MSERIQLEVMELPEPLQVEVLDYVRYLAARGAQETAPNDEPSFSDLSPPSAMRGMEDEETPLYSLNDLRQVCGIAEVSDEGMRALSRKWRINRLSVFGSALSGRLRPDSDIDLLVEFEPGEEWSLMDLIRAEAEFSGVFGRRVELVDKSGLERSSNWIRRDAILKTAKVIYAA